ncbi:MAG: hypothetical protein RI842_03920 [Schleiferiaceae bacterium]|nr:hypothetical protein [Schleiferiaceae bacterium]
MSRYRPVFLCVFILLSLFRPLQAQEARSGIFQLTPETHFYLNGAFQAATTGYDPLKLWQRWQKQRWTAADKAYLMDRAGTPLRMGLTSQLALGLRVPHDDSRALFPRFDLSLSYRNLIGAQLEKPLLGLALYGNAPYAGQALRFQNTAYTALQMTTLRFRKSYLLGPWQWQWGLGLHGIHSQQHFALGPARFRTAAAGTYLDFQGTFDRQASPQNFLPGMGLSLNGGLAFRDFALRFQDLGFGHYPQNTRHQSPNFRYRFTGQFLPNPFDPLVYDAEEVLQDSVAALRSDGYQALLPFRATLRHHFTPAEASWRLRTWLRYRHLPGYGFQAGGQMYFRPSRRHHFYAQAVYGGWEQLRVGGGYRWQSAHFRLRAEIGSLSYPLPGRLGHSLQARLQLSLPLGSFADRMTLRQMEL